MNYGKTKGARWGVIAFYSKIMEGSSIKLKKIEDDLGIVIYHENKEYTLSENEEGKLTLRLINEVEMMIKPKAANSIQIGE